MTSSSGADPHYAPVPPGWPGDDPTLPDDVDGPAPAGATPPEADEPDSTGAAGGAGATGATGAAGAAGGAGATGATGAAGGAGAAGAAEGHEAPGRPRLGHADPHEAPGRHRARPTEPPERGEEHEAPGRLRYGAAAAGDDGRQGRRPGRARRRVSDDDDSGHRPAHARPRRTAAAVSLPGNGAPGLDAGGRRGIGADDDTGDLDVDAQHLGDLDVDPQDLGAVDVDAQHLGGLEVDAQHLGAADLDAADVDVEDDDEPGTGPGAEDGDAGMDAADLDDLVAGVQPAGRVLVVVVASLLLAMLINADDLVERAERKPPGPARDRSLAIWHPVQDVSHALQLHRVRDLAEWLVGDDDDPAEEAAPPSTAEDDGAPGGRDIDDERVGGVASPGDDTTTGDGDGDARDGGRGHRGPGADGEPDGSGGAEPRVPRATGDAVRVPTADAPLRLWVGGDSMAEMFGRSLVTAAEGTGLVEGTLHYEMASGLTRPDYYDWPDALADDLDDHDPEVVVMIVGANDGQGIVLEDGTPVPEVSDPRWLPEYRRRVGAVMDQLHADGRIVFWVGQPPMLDADYDARMQIVNQAYAAEAATRPWITFVDSTAVLGDPSGAFADVLPDAAGSAVDLRRDDGIHLTAEGADRLAVHVFGIIASRVDLSGPA